MELKKLLKNRNNRVMLVILIIGIVIIMFSNLFTDKESEASRTPKGNEGEEERLSEILSEIDGAGRVSVMISYEQTKVSNDGIGRGFGYDDSQTEEKPKGVIVVADGGDDPDVRRKLKEAACAVSGAGANRVCVYDRKEDK